MYNDVERKRKSRLANERECRDHGCFLCTTTWTPKRLLKSGFSTLSDSNVRVAVKEVETIVPCAPLDKKTLIDSPHDALSGG